MTREDESSSGTATRKTGRERQQDAHNVVGRRRYSKWLANARSVDGERVRNGTADAGGRTVPTTVADESDVGGSVTLGARRRRFTPWLPVDDREPIGGGGGDNPAHRPVRPASLPTAYLRPRSCSVAR